MVETNAGQFMGIKKLAVQYVSWFFCAALAAGVATHAYASINNTVTVTGSALSGINNVIATAVETVDVVDAASGLDIIKTATLNDTNSDGFADVGETITYVYRVTNTGNVTLTNVGVQDTHEGALLTGADLPAGETIISEGPFVALSLSAPSDIGVANDGIIDRFSVGSVATFTVTLIVTQEEVDDG